MIPSFKQFLVEEDKVAYFTFGRMNPPTIGHGKLMDALSAKAGRNPYFVYLSQSQNAKKDPLEYTAKIKHVRKMFPKHARSVVINKKVTNPFFALSDLYDKGYRKVIMVAGSDRVTEYDLRLNKYNGKKGAHGFFNFEGGIQIVSAGQRDPEGEGAEGASGTKQRQFASDNNFSGFGQGLPRAMSNADSRRLFNDVRKGMGLKEENEFKRHIQLDTVSETRERFIEGKLFELGEAVIIKATDQIGKIDYLGSNYVIVEMNDGSKTRQWLEAVEQIEGYNPQNMEWGTDASTKWAKKMTPGEVDETVTQGQINDLEKFADKLLAKYDIDIEFTRHFADRMNDVRNNPDIKVAELQKFFKKIQKAKGNKIKSMDDFQAVLKDVKAQLNIPAVIKHDKNGEIEVTLKTIMRKKNFTTPNKVINYESRQDPDIKDREGTQPARYHTGLSKATKVARDRHFQAKKAGPAPGDANAKTKPSKHTSAVGRMLGEGSFADKSKASGISVEVLKKVYARGVAAWKTGHRPGTTPSQWGHARVNAFISKKKKGGLNHDNDLA